MSAPMHDSRERQREEVARNYEAFLAGLPSLMEKHKGRYAVYRHRRLVDIFDSATLAFQFGDHAYDDGQYSVQEINDEPYYSR